MGKSMSGELLKKRGLAVVDTDVIARQIVEPRQPALLEIQKAFGETIVGGDGRLRRDELAKRVFANAVARRKLEDILHPRIREIWQEEVKAWRAKGCAVGFVIIPLLFETDAASHFDATICVACTNESQRERLRKRGWSDEQIQQRIESQWPVDKKMALSDYVVWTETSVEVHDAQLGKILNF